MNTPHAPDPDLFVWVLAGLLAILVALILGLVFSPYA